MSNKIKQPIDVTIQDKNVIYEEILQAWSVHAQAGYDFNILDIIKKNIVFLKNYYNATCVAKVLSFSDWLDIFRFLHKNKLSDDYFQSISNGQTLAIWEVQIIPDKIKLIYHYDIQDDEVEIHLYNMDTDNVTVISDSEINLLERLIKILFPEVLQEKFTNDK